jgi:predicted nuclease of predicted toxin-antitoxin system
VKVKLDANLGRRGRAVLLAAGYDVATATEQSLATAPDAALIEMCRRESRALVTLDTDFGNAMAYPPHAYAGIVVLRMHQRATAAEIDAVLRAFVAAVAGSSLAGRLLVADHGGRVREYHAGKADD